MKKVIFLFILMISFTGVTQGNTSVQTISVFPTQNNGYLKNPGKGWVIYKSLDNVSKSVLDKGSIGYSRYLWKDIHLADHTFDWSKIDDDIAKAVSKGLKWSFGVMPVSGGLNTKDMPDWVVDAGAGYYAPETGDSDSKIPIWDDPVFIEKMTQFVNAMATRYNGSKNIAYIDNRFYGNWGEGHLGHLGGTPPSDDILKSFVDIYNTAFTQTTIIQPNAYQKEYARDKYNNGWRFDSAEHPGYWDRLADNSFTAPAVAEISGGYERNKNGGSWHKNVWTDDMLIQSILKSRYSYYSMGGWNGNDADTFLSEKEYLIDEWQNKMGYWFKMTEAKFSSNLGNGKDGAINFSIRNDGVARQCVLNSTGCLKLALMDDNYNVLQTVQLTNINPINWAPSEEKVENANFSFSYSPSGTRLALGVFTKSTLVHPDTKLGIDNGTKDNWYVLTDMNAEHASINASAGEDRTICLGDSVTLTASGGSNYSWNTGSTTQSITVSPAKTSTYSVTVSERSESSTDEVFVTVENCKNEILEDEKDLTILEMNLYPNPTNGGFNIRINNLNQDSNLIINDVKGTLIYSEQINGRVNEIHRNLNFTSFADGIYFIRLFNSKENLVKKLVLL